jgi:hypothetical protein
MRWFRNAIRHGARRRPVALHLTELETRCTPAGFIGVNQQDEVNSGSNGFPPDTMGAAGPNNFVEFINGAVAIYNNTTGSRVSYTTLDNFFTFTSSLTVYPRNGTFDPRILYDQHSGHWFASCLEGGPSATGFDILLAVSRTSDPTGTWDRYDIPVGVSANSSESDYDTLGVDDNGVYFGVTIFPAAGGQYEKIAATPKGPLIAASPSLGAVTQWTNITDMEATPQPADNYDAVATNDPEFFVSSSVTVYGDVNYRTLTWNNGTPSLSATTELTTPAYGNFPPNAPALGSTTNVDTGDDRLMMAIVRNHQLWTARDIGVDASGSANGFDRSAVEWLELGTSGTSLSLTQSGRIYNSSANPVDYYYPSLTVTGQGDMRIAFSGSNGSQYVGAYSAGRLANDPPGVTTAPVLIKAGESSYNEVAGGRNRWGDFSYTSTDPNDNMTAWTVQEYAGPGTNNWATWVQTLPAPAPTLNNPNGSGTQGQNAVTLNLTGTGFYDPGAGFPNHLQVQLTGGTVNGISNVVTTYNSPTSATVTFNIAANASVGSRNIVLTNPDGQMITVNNGFTVNPAATPPTVQSVVVNDGSAQRSEVRSITVTFSSTVNFSGGNANAAAAFQLNHVQTGNNVILSAAVSTINNSTQTVVTLTFSGSNPSTEVDAVSELNGGVPSLADGRYTLTVFGSSVTGTDGIGLAGNGSTAGTNYVSPPDTYQGNGLHLYRLFGDVNGDGVDDATDVGQLKSTFNRNNTDPLYISFLDADNSGAVDAQDVGQFKLRFNTNVFG